MQKTQTFGDQPGGGTLLLHHDPQYYVGVVIKQLTPNQVIELPEPRDKDTFVGVGVTNHGNVSFVICGETLEAGKSITINWSGSGYLAAKQDTTTQDIEPVAESILVPTILADGSLELDKRDSLLDGTRQGGELGYHSYTFQAIRQELDIQAGSTPLAMIAGANVDTDGTYWWKSIAGNSWNSYIRSEDPIGNADTQNFALSVPIEADHDSSGAGGVDGSVREMLQLSNDPSANSSYTASTHSAYQVNTNVYVYEGSSYVGNFAVGGEEGGEIFLICQDGVVSVAYVENDVVNTVYTSPVKLEGPVYARAAFNRGNESTGDSVMGNFKVHTTSTPKAIIVHVDGAAKADISVSDTETLNSIGLFPIAGSNYGLLTCTKPDTDTYPDGIDYQIEHGYYSRSPSSSVTVQV